MDWDKLKIFHTVAESGSFTKASTVLNLSQSAISRQIQSLEDDLKVKLFERHARGLTLTENGEYVYKTAHEVISKLKETIDNGTSFGAPTEGEILTNGNNIYDKYQGRGILFHNETNNNNHWIKVRLEGVESNKDAFGSKVLVYTENEAFSLSLVSGQGYFSSHAKELYFGLGTEKHIEKIFRY